MNPAAESINTSPATRAAEEAAYEAKKKVSYIMTVSGQVFPAFDPKAEDIHIEDVAHALSMLCRYGGHSPKFYSVAEHCVWASETMQKWSKRPLSPATWKCIMWALLHDASEAYLVDMPRPIKMYMPEYASTEDKIQEAVIERFDIDMSPVDKALVHHVDNSMLFFEKDAFGWADRIWQIEPPQMYYDCHDWGIVPEIAFWTPEEAQKHFMARFTELTEHGSAPQSRT